MESPGRRVFMDVGFFGNGQLLLSESYLVNPEVADTEAQADKFWRDLMLRNDLTDPQIPQYGSIVRGNLCITLMSEIPVAEVSTICNTRRRLFPDFTDIIVTSGPSIYMLGITEEEDGKIINIFLESSGTILCVLTEIYIIIYDLMEKKRIWEVSFQETDRFIMNLTPEEFISCKDCEYGLLVTYLAKDRENNAEITVARLFGRQ